MSKNVIRIFGSCNPKTKMGGYSAIVGERVITGGAADTTTARMELTALIKALETFRPSAEKREVQFYAKSKYIANGMMNFRERRENGFQTKAGTEMANLDLWGKLIDTANKRNIFIKVAK